MSGFIKRLRLLWYGSHKVNLNNKLKCKFLKGIIAQIKKLVVQVQVYGLVYMVAMVICIFQQ